MLRIISLSLFYLFSLFATAQSPNLGILPISNFPKSVYNAGTQNWDIAQDEEGIMYFANNSGLLQFDGTYWKLFSLTNKTIVRSVAVSPDNKIYVGGQGEFGYFVRDNRGELKYHSLSHLVPKKYQYFSDVWDIVFSEMGIFFRSAEMVFKVFRNDLQVFDSTEPIEFLGLLNDNVIFQKGNQDIYHFHNGIFQFYSKIENLGSRITGIIETNNGSIYLSSLKNGIFKFEDESFSKIITGHENNFFNTPIYCASALPYGKIALGMTPGGLQIFDENWKLIRHIKKDQGLQNANVLSLYSDKDKNLWLGLDTGLDYLETESPLSKIYPDGANEGTAYAIKIHQDHIYFGTNHGLYMTEWKEYYNPLEASPFKLVQNTSGQVWGLSTIGENLFLGHHEGAYIITNEVAERLSTVSTWLFLPFEDDFIIGGHYSGLSAYQKTEGQIKFLGNLGGLNESSRIMVQRNPNEFWMAHPYRGVFKVKPDLEKMMAYYKFYNSNHGLPSDQSNHVFEISKKPIFAGETGVYDYTEHKDSFNIYSPLNDFFDKSQRIKTLITDKDGNIWFSAGNEVGLLNIIDLGIERKIEKKIIPELSNELVNGFEMIYPYDRNNIFFGTEKGFIHFNLEKYLNQNDDLRLVLSEIILSSNDSLIQSTVHQSASNPDSSYTTLLPFQNNLQFKYSALVYGQNEKIQFQTKLNGFDEKWSPWSENNTKSFTNLPPGSYTFQIRAKNSFNKQSESVYYSFIISPPWYSSMIAYTIYIFVILGSLAGFLYFQQTKFETEKAALKSVHEKKVAIHQQDAFLSKQEITRLHNERLEAENKHKTQELASATMHLVQKKEMLSKIKRELEKVISGNKEKVQVKSDIRRIINLLSQDKVLDDDWSHFERNFDQVHSNFLQKLREQFPQLSPNDYKLCAYLRMNLATKEIAPLMNISVRGVEASRYRLRKKLELGNDVNLVDFMLNIK